MGDRLSSQSLGKDLYIAHAISVRGIDQKTAISEWIDNCTDEGKSHWAAAAQKFCKFLKEAQADS